MAPDKISSNISLSNADSDSSPVLGKVTFKSNALQYCVIL